MSKYDYYYEMKKRKEAYKPITSVDISFLKPILYFIYMITGCATFVTVLMLISMNLILIAK